MQTQIKEAMFNAKPAADHADRNEQYSRRNNVKLLYVPEAAGSFESAEGTERKALQVFHNRLDLKHITPERIEAAHRVGEKKKSRQHKTFSCEVSFKKNNAAGHPETM